MGKMTNCSRVSAFVGILAENWVDPSPSNRPRASGGRVESVGFWIDELPIQSATLRDTKGS